MKKLGASLYVSAVAIVLAVVSLIMFRVAMGTSQGYFDAGYSGITTTLIVLAVVFIAASAGAALLKAGGAILQVVQTVLSVGACLCLGYAVGCVIGAIATEFAYTYFSNFNVGTIKETFIPGACTQAIVSIVCSIAAIFAVAVSAQRAD